MLHRRLLLANLLACWLFPRWPRVRQYCAGDSVDPHEWAILGQADEERQLRLRRLAQAAAAAGFAAKTTGELSLPVQFALTRPTSCPRLSAARRRGRRHPPAARRKIGAIQATPTRPADQYNELLSQRRAQAVKQYLVASHSISGAPACRRANTRGRDPLRQENRRVQFRGE
jgi:hypothetical protein